MRRFNLAVFFLLIPCGRLAAQTQPQPLPSNVKAQVDKVFEKLDKSDSPGCALGVYRDGQIIYKHGYGMANLNDDVPITPATVFHVASMSKQFTAASIVLLAQQGKLSLDDDVRKYIPDLPDFGERITIRHLVHHTSGLRDQWSLLGLAGWRYSLDLITDDDVMSVMTRQKDLNFKPGEKHVYCNTGYTLMGLIVKRVSGMSLRDQEYFRAAGHDAHAFPRRPRRDCEAQCPRIRAGRQKQALPAERYELRHRGRNESAHHGGGPPTVGREFLSPKAWRAGVPPANARTRQTQ